MRVDQLWVDGLGGWAGPGWLGVDLCSSGLSRQRRLSMSGRRKVFLLSCMQANRLPIQAHISCLRKTDDPVHLRSSPSNEALPWRTWKLAVMEVERGNGRASTNLLACLRLHSTLDPSRPLLSQVQSGTLLVKVQLVADKGELLLSTIAGIWRKLELILIIILIFTWLIDGPTSRPSYLLPHHHCSRRLC